jgi:hypothetical protein
VTGVVIGMADERYHVRLDTGKELKVRKANLDTHIE